MIKGNQAVFLVSGSGGAVAATRGVNGYIPYTTVSNVQNTCTLIEAHGAFKRTQFNIFASQGDQKRIMQDSCVDVLNRHIDQVIIDELDTATNDTGTSAPASLNMVIKAITILGNNEVDTSDEDNMFGLVTPAFRGYLMLIPEFTSADFVEVKPFVGPARKMVRWAGVNWMFHSGLTGVGTSTEDCYIWHKNAMGHAANSQEMDSIANYDDEQDLSYARSTLYHGAKLLQNDGIVNLNHDGSAFAAS